MWRHGSIGIMPRTSLFLVLLGISCVFPWDASGALAGELTAVDRDIDLYLRGVVPPEWIRAAGSPPDGAGLARASGAGLADTIAVWEEIPPVVRVGHSAVFDAARRRMVVFGGLNGDDFSNKTWVFTPGPEATWELLGSRLPNPTDYTPGDSIRRPSPRTGQATVLIGDHLVVIGGFDARGPRNDVWALDLAAGSEELVVDSSVSGSSLPAPRAGHTAVYDPEGQRVLVFGGTAGDSLDFLDDAWELDPDLAAHTARWTQIVVAPAAADSLPGARVGHAAVYDPTGKRMLVFGGLDEKLEPLNDTWALWLSAGSGPLRWERIQSRSGEALVPRVRPAAVFDAKHNRMLVFAGVNRDGYLDDLWELKLDPKKGWKPILHPAEGPGGRVSPSAVIDVLHDCLLVFGGSRGGFDLDDTWALPLQGQGTSKWTRVSPLEGGPGARLGHAAAYDALRGRMLLVGGTDGEPLIDVWELRLSERMSWHRLRIQGEAPPGRSGHTVVYDPVRDRLLVFGGLNLVYLDDLWELPLGAVPGQLRWNRLSPAGTSPSGRTDHTTVYDASRRRIVVFGGIGASGRTNDAWQLALDGSMAWARLEAGGDSPPAAISEPVAVYDPLYDRMVVWGWPASEESPSAAWELCFGEGSEPGSCDPDVPTWKQLPTLGEAPVWRFGQSAVYDPIGQRMLLFGGGFQGGRRLEYGNQVHELTLDSTPTWSHIEPRGDVPRARVRHSAIYDPGQNRMVVYGGGRLAKPESYHADLWTLTLGAAEAAESVVADGPPGGSGSDGRSGKSDAQGLALALPQPNPTHGGATVVITLPGDDAARIEILDVRGRCVRARDLGSLGAGTHTLRIAERGTLAPGVYLLRLFYGTRTLTGKLAVLR
jgi:hypothetical protein